MRSFAFAFAVVSLCVVLTTGRFVYEPGSCREDARQNDVNSCMSGKFLCQWCEIDESTATSDMVGAIKSEYSVAERTAYVALWRKGVPAENEEDKRRVQETLTTKYTDMIEAVEPFNKAFPQRCARKWSASTCPGKIYIPITRCEAARRRLKEALDDAEKERRSLPYREHSDHDSSPVSSHLQERVSLRTDTVNEVCGESTTQNSPTFARSSAVVDGLYSLAASSSKNILVNYPLSVDEERRSAFIARYVKWLLPGNSVRVAEEPRAASRPHSCHQYTLPQACHLAGCSYCPPANHDEHQEEQKAWPPCQPAWDCKTCTKTAAVDQFESAVHTSPTTQMWADFTDHGVFIAPEASLEKMTAFQEEAKGIAAKRKRSRRDPCRALGTLSTCLSGKTSSSEVAGPSCEWCVIPVDSALPQCRSKWNSATDSEAVCYSPPLVPDSLATIKSALTSAYSAALSEKLTLIQLHMRDVRENSPSGGSRCAPLTPVPPPGTPLTAPVTSRVTRLTHAVPAPPSRPKPTAYHRRPGARMPAP